MEKRIYDNNILAFDRITKNIKRIIDTVLKEHGLRSTHASCFFRICEANDGLTSTELAEACGVDKAFISRITAELMENGYICKDPNSVGMIYKRKFVLTEKGHEIYDALLKELSQITEKTRYEITDTKLQAFTEVLSTLDKNIIDYLKGGI
jgi:DNA-binding MarR family transcriptional regulator